MRVWLLALAACGAAPTVIGNRAPVGGERPARSPRLALDPIYAGCDDTGCPLSVARSVTPGSNGLERDVAIRHRKLIVVHRFEY